MRDKITGQQNSGYSVVWYNDSDENPWSALMFFEVHRAPHFGEGRTPMEALQDLEAGVPDHLKAT